MQREGEVALVAAVGLFVALVGVAVVVGAPWRYTGGGVAMLVLRGGGALLTTGIGVGLLWLALRTR